jgi:hypothetical protein
MVLPDPGDDPICVCAEEGGADFIVTLNPRDFPQGKLKARNRTTIGYVECNITDEQNRLVARAASTCMVLRGQKASGR